MSSKWLCITLRLARIMNCLVPLWPLLQCVKTQPKNMFSSINHATTSGHSPYSWWRLWLPLKTALSMIVAHLLRLCKPLSTREVQLLTLTAFPALVGLPCQASNRGKMAVSLSENTANSHCLNPTFSSFSSFNAH